MYYRILTILGGFWLIYFGFSSISDKGSHFRGFVIQRSSGIFLFILGITLILYAFFKKSWPQISKEYYKCPNCKSVFDYEETHNKICPKCNSKMEELRNFFKRHPEKKENEKQNCSK